MSKLKKLTEEFLAKRDKVLQMGGEEKLAQQRALGKLNVRERLDHLFDEDTFVETGILGHHQDMAPDMKGKYTPADGCVTGYGKIDGRLVCVAAYDFTVMAGSIGFVQEKKVARMREMALRERIPMIWLLDSAGARIQEIAGSQFAESGHLFLEQVKMSGVVPQIAAVMGPCAAGTAYIPALADFVPMVKGTSSMALAGPPLVKAVIGEEISAEDLGGSKVHCHVSGVADLECKNDQECLKAIREYLSYFPQNSGQKPPLTTIDEKSDRMDDSVLDILPDSSNKPYDMHKILEKIADEGKFFEMKPDFGTTVLTAFLRVGGHSVGVVASQPMIKGGILDNDSADKSARFINLCDAFNIPLLFLQDVPGFMVGSEVEKQGIIRHGAKMLYAVSRASVPKITVVIRKAYGAGYYVMCGRGYEPDIIVAWPTAEISLMGAEGAVNIIFRKAIEAADDPKAARQQLVEIYQKEISVEKAASGGYIDEVIDPRDTRQIIINTLELASNKEVNWPKKKHGVMPV
jgi:acetyl-CoA carboxylase carboxyltransferase component